MIVLFGLGNPEDKYKNTRHNIGKTFLNFYADTLNIEADWKSQKYIAGEYIKYEGIILVKPEVYMNDSGSSAHKTLSHFEVSPKNFVLIYDDLDLEVGEHKLTFDKGSRIHNGVVSVKEAFQQEAFWHLRTGVRGSDIPFSVQKTGRDPGDYVLEHFNLSDSGKIEKYIQNAIIPDLNEWLSKNK